MENMISAKEAADYLTDKFGWPVKPHDIGVLARSTRYAIRIDQTRHRHLYNRQDIESAVLEGPNAASQCRRPFWPRGGDVKPGTLYFNNARKMS